MKKKMYLKVVMADGSEFKFYDDSMSELYARFTAGLIQAEQEGLNVYPAMFDHLEVGYNDETDILS